MFSLEEDGFNANNLSFNEHTGTHLDAPFHFDADGETAEEIEVERLIAPLAVLDISDRAARDADATVTVDDIRAWEKRHGRLPGGAFVAAYSGWEERISDPVAFLNADSSETLHFPGFGVEAAEFLVDERDVVGAGVDTASLDPGNTQDFGAHLALLGAGKYGLENLANLREVRPSGATIIVGGPKHEGATGGPARVFAVEGGSPQEGRLMLPDTGGAEYPAGVFFPR